MSTAPGATTRSVAVGTCCVVAGLAYSGAVTVTALLTFVLPSVLLVAIVTAGVARRSVRLAAFAGLATALAVAEVVNLTSGTGNGPAARSTFAAAAFTALAVAAASSPAPALFTAGVVGVVVGALGLGAGSEVAPVAVATAVVAIAALAVVEASSRRWTRRPPQITAVLAFTLLAGVVVAAIALQSDRRLEGEPAVLAPGAVQPSIRPPEALGDPDPVPTANPTPSDSTDTSASPPSSEPDVPVGTIWLVVLMVVLTLLVGLVLRILWIAVAWRLLRRQLRRGTDNEQIAGAWVWSTLRLRAAGWPMPPSLSADAVSAGRGTEALPRALRIPLRRVANSTVDAVYAPPIEAQDSAPVWKAADEVGTSAITTLGTTRRLGFALRGISSVPSSPAVPEPQPLEEFHA